MMITPEQIRTYIQARDQVREYLGSLERQAMSRLPINEFSYLNIELGEDSSCISFHSHDCGFLHEIWINNDQLTPDGIVNAYTLSKIQEAETQKRILERHRQDIEKRELVELQRLQDKYKQR